MQRILPILSLVGVTCASAALAEPTLWTLGPLPRPATTLALHTGPAPGFERIGQLSPGAVPFEKRHCVRLITAPAERDAMRLPEWCQIARNGEPLGWVMADPLIPAEDALRIVRGWRGENDACKLIGESALTGDFLDDSADLVGCPAGAQSSLPRNRRGILPLGEMLGFDLFSVTRN